jgi:regulator of replication initiation timing
MEKQPNTISLPELGFGLLPVNLIPKGFQDLKVQIFQAILGGTGTGGLVAIIFWQLGEANWKSIFNSSFVAGIAVFCLELIVFSFLDQGRILTALIRKQLELNRFIEEMEKEWEEQIEELESTLEEAISEIEQLHAQAKTLRNERNLALAELSNLRHQIASGRSTTYRSKVDLYEKPRQDAKTLIQLALEGKAWPARDRAIEQLGWNRERWETAFKTLKDSGVVKQEGVKGNHVRILVTNLEKAFQLIDQATGVYTTEEFEKAA